jgi:hypothetical protein
MAITFVGSNTGTGSGATTITIPMPVGVATGDVVYVAAMSSQTVDVDCTEGSGTWTEIADLYANDTDDCNLCVFRKVMGGTPDTDVTLTVRTTAGASVGLSYALRGVDTTTPEDATATTATSADASKPDPPSITTVTANAWVIAIGGSSEADAVTNPPTNYSNLAVNTDGGGLLRNVMMASREIASPGAEDPAVFNDISGTTSDSWCAVSVAVRPAASGSTYTIDAASASYTYSATDADLLHGYLIDADAASYAWTAQDATLTRDIPLSAESAAYTWTATDASLEYVPIGSTYTLDAAAAAYLWTATDADLVYVQLVHRTLDADSAAYTWTASDAGLEWSGEETGSPTGGWRTPPSFDRHETADQRRRERERLGILPKQQRAIDRAAVKIAATVPQGGLLAAPVVIAAPAFDRLLEALRPTEGQVMALVQAILDRIAAMQAEEADDAEFIRMLMEMD